MELLRAFNRTVKATGLTGSEDAALVESGRTIARSVDAAVSDGNGLKASYLIPHMVNVLREMGATPTVRAAAAKKSTGSSSVTQPADELAAKRSWRTA